MKDRPQTEKLLAVEKQFKIQMRRELILQKLREKGFRITKQRIAVIDSILENDSHSCKEIIYKTNRQKKNIGTATVYRTINMLEEIGAIERKNLYQLSNEADILEEHSGVIVSLQDGTEHHFSMEEWREILCKGLKACGYLSEGNILSVIYQTEKNNI